MAFTAIFVLISTTSTSAWFYVICVLFGCVLAVQVSSMMVHVYSNNYRPNEKRGKISSNLMLSSAAEGTTALVIGLILDWDLGYFKFIAFGTFFLGYWVLTNLGPGAVSWVSATLIMLGCVIFVIIASDKRLSSNCS